MGVFLSFIVTQAEILFGDGSGTEAKSPSVALRFRWLFVSKKRSKVNSGWIWGAVADMLAVKA